MNIFWSKNVLCDEHVIAIPMQVMSSTLQKSLAQALEESEARKQHEQILEQQLNVRSGWLHELTYTVHVYVRCVWPCR